MHLQNMLAYIAGHFEMVVDKTVILRGFPGHLYLNTAERGMSICNLARANHAVSIDPNKCTFLLEILHGCHSMKQVHETIQEYNHDLLEAIKFRRDNSLCIVDPEDGEEINSQEPEDMQVEVPSAPNVGVSRSE
eukprot:9400860-Ditylum_brightwellii.AAC.1